MVLLARSTQLSALSWKAVPTPCPTTGGASPAPSASGKDLTHVAGHGMHRRDGARVVHPRGPYNTHPAQNRARSVADGHDRRVAHLLGLVLLADPDRDRARVLRGGQQLEHHDLRLERLEH